MDYVHGYSAGEAQRLDDQATTLADLLHDGTAYPPGSRVLEAGCGIGAQTAHLVARSPGARIVAIDRSARSLEQARQRVSSASVEWHQGDIFALPFADASFDHVFVCFVLEHLADPVGALIALGRVLRPGGTITVIEGDHATAVFHPDSADAQATIDCLVRLQARANGDGLLGRRVQPLLAAAGYHDVRVAPRTVYADATRPDLVEGFTRQTFIAMVEPVGPSAIASGLISRERWERGLDHLRRTAEDGGTFHYAFFKGVAVRPERWPV